MHLVMSVCVWACLSIGLSVCPACAFFFESLDPATSYLAWMYIFRISTSSLCIKVIVSRSRSQEENGIYEHNATKQCIPCQIDDVLVLLAANSSHLTQIDFADWFWDFLCLIVFVLDYLLIYFESLVSCGRLSYQLISFRVHIKIFAHSSLYHILLISLLSSSLFFVHLSCEPFGCGKTSACASLNFLRH